MAGLSLVPGQWFAGDFIVERELSEGGMGVVYVALQQSTNKRRALKVMHPRLVSASDPAQAQRNQQRFLAEARAGGAIQSQHVVEVVTAGIDPQSGAPWMVMELLDGHDLNVELRQRERLPPGELLGLFEQLCHALGAAHRAGVFHLDLKPENIFLAASHSARGGTTVKVLDFGISRLVSEHMRSATVTTAAGSPFWMSPEQSTRGARVGAYTDVWALGLIAFRALTGCYYWREANAPSHEINVTGWVLEMMISPLDPASARAHEYGVAALLPPGFDAWFARCVTRDVAARFEDATACFAALASLHAPQASQPSAAAQSLPAAPRAPTRAVSGTPYAPTMAAYGAPTLAAMPPTAPLPTAAHSGSPSAGVLAAAGATGLLALVLVTAAGWSLTHPSRDDRPEAPSAMRANTASVRPGIPGVPAVACPAEMAAVAAGTFLMGAASGQGDEGDQPEHPVALSGFCIDRTEVTVAAYRACVRAGRCLPAPAAADWPGASSTDLAHASAWCNADREDRSDHPVNCVDWSQAATYCAWAHKRLPTEAEWEYAARGTDGRLYPWGDDPPTPARLNACGPECQRMAAAAGLEWDALYAADDGWAATSPAGRFSQGASAFGALDMAGNVWEWTADWHGPYHSAAAAPTDPTGPRAGTYRMIRGGSWHSSESARTRTFRDNNGWNHTEEEGVRATLREWSPPAAHDPIVGFRCASGGGGGG